MTGRGTPRLAAALRDGAKKPLARALKGWAIAPPN